MPRLREDDVARCAELLARMRSADGILERTPGVFYRGSVPFLHFHGHGDALVADLRVGRGWLRYPARTVTQRRLLAVDARRVLAGRTRDLRGKPR